MNKFGLVLGVIFLFGCSSTNVITLKPAPSKSEECGLDLYSSKQEIKRPYESICIVETITPQGLAFDRTINGAIEQGKPTLCKCGADAAVVLQGSSGEFFGVDHSGKAKLEGVKYLD